MNNNNDAAEQQRLESLRSFQILDTLPEREFDDLTLLVSQICDTPIATISLVDENRQWFKSRVGLTSTETPRNVSFCTETIKSNELLVVPDAERDARFADNPMVTGEPNIRFYAGAPLITSDGSNLGAICVVDHQTRELTDAQKFALSALSRSVVGLLEARREITDLKNTLTGTFSGPVFSESVPDDTTGDVSAAQTSTGNESFFQLHLKHYLVAAVIIAVATLVKFWLDSITHIEAPFLVFVCAILLAAWRGGLGPGIFTTLATVVIIYYYFLIPPNFSVEPSSGQLFLLLVFAAQGVLMTLLCVSRIRGEKRLNSARNHLEKRVAGRTNELAQANRILHKEIQERSDLQRDLRQARDQAIESARLKSEFLANMSHEIRTPMNGVIGVAGLLLDTPLDGEQRRFAEIIRNSGESLLTVINDILDFSKVEAGKIELEMLDFDLRTTIESTVELLSNRAQQQQNELAVLIYNDVPLSLCGDAGRIQQILTNLIGNAVKFTKGGDVVVRVKKLDDSDSHAQLKFSVSDTGEGISPAALEKLFQPFTQSDASTTRRFGGTGLGLSISRKLVEMMSGEIGVESELGKGSTFWFTLTLEKQKKPATANRETVELAADFYPLTGKNVLVVDDHPVNREILLYQTRAWNMNAQEACGGTQAIDLIDQADRRGQPFELILLDLQMPEMDGLETARRINSKLHRSEDSPAPAVIMLSSSVVKIGDEARREAGIGLLLTKPYRQVDLLDGIYDTLNINRREKRGAAKTEHQPADDLKFETAPAAGNFSGAAGRQKRILLVEDNQVNQMVAQVMLKKMGYQIDIAGNGLEALKALELLPYDLVLMDCQMPEMDGYEATRAIRARAWKAAEIPIIALTAHAIEGEREKCLRAGMNDYLSKPVQKDDLQAVLKRWITAAAEENEADESAAETAENSEIEPNSADGAASVIPSVDFAVLDDITDNDTEVRREVVEIYLAQTITHLAQIERAITINDAETLSNVAHKTVGGSAICGMTAIVEPLRKLERMGLDGRTDGAAPLLAQARQAFVAISEQCAEILRK